MFYDEDKMKAAENCSDFQSTAPFITNSSFMSLSCNACINYRHGKCSKALTEKINNTISIN